MRDTLDTGSMYEMDAVLNNEVLKIQQNII